MYPRSPATRTLMDYSPGSMVRREAVCRLIYEPRRARRDTWGGPYSLRQHAGTSGRQVPARRISTVSPALVWV